MMHTKPSIVPWTALLLPVLCLLGPPPAAGIPASPHPAGLEQPDGTRILVQLRGDEFFSWHESEDGLVILKDPASGYWVYAKEADGRLAPTDLVVGRDDGAAAGLPRPDLPAIRAGATARSEHRPEAFEKDLADIQATTLRNLVILVDFADLAVVYPQNDYDDMFNQVGFSAGGAVGSVRDYYDEISYGELTVVSTVTGPVQVGAGFAFYGANDGDGNDVNPRAMVTEAIFALDATGFDFSTMDGNGDGWVDCLTIVHAGRGEEFSGNDPNYIWSHKWELVMPIALDGVLMQHYHTEPAQHGEDSNPATWSLLHIGVVCHEMGHFIGLPDLYDRDGGSRGAGFFCLMASGNWCGDQHIPSHMSAWCKMQLGWVAPTWVSGDGLYSVVQVATNPSAVGLHGIYTNHEYFLVENRQGVGFDAGLPGPQRGILIWHIDPLVGHNDDPAHYMVDVEEASGTQELQLDLSRGDEDDYWRAGHMTDFTVASTPNNIRYNGEALSMEITDISASTSAMNFQVTSYHTWVDFSYPSVIEMGTYRAPFNSLLEGLADVPDGGGLAIKNGTSTATINTVKNCTIYAPFGDVVIGP